MELKQAVEVLVKALNEDESYRYSWQSNIAVPFQDAWQRSANNGGLPCTPDQIHKISNDAAINFLENFTKARP